jgi:hypothetical protein
MGVPHHWSHRGEGTARRFLPSGWACCKAVVRSLACLGFSLLALTAAVPALAIDGPASIETQQELDDRFELFNHCQPVSLVVQAANAPIDEARIRTTAESRLRSARLYDPAADSVLWVSLTYYSGSFSWSVDLSKRLYDERSRRVGSAFTWRRGGVGYASNPQTMIGSIAEYVDEFLLHYLRVNEADCDQERAK